MTHRTRISKKAQRRRRRDFEIGALIDVSFDTFYGAGYHYAIGIDPALGLGQTIVPGHDPNWTPDMTAIAVYVQGPDGTLFFYDSVRLPLQRAVYRIADMRYLKLAEKQQAMRSYMLGVLKNAIAGPNAWAKLMQQSVAEALENRK